MALLPVGLLSVVLWLSVLSSVIWISVASDLPYHPVAVIHSRGPTRVIGQYEPIGDTEVSQYLGVPFAQPPVGRLRFRKPRKLCRVPHTIWAWNQPPACPQHSHEPYEWSDNGTGKSEDCLYLNIWAPKDAGPQNRKAVLFWIYGGGYQTGSNRLPVYDGRALSAFGDVVVVVPNYRLGALGFLYSGTSFAPGNAGLWDIALALHWVNEFIGSFGGDRHRITIGGESAGSVAVSYLTTTPLTRGLFQRAIMQSGVTTPLARSPEASRRQALSTAQNLAKRFGCANDTYQLDQRPCEVIRCLAGVDYREIEKAVSGGPPTFLPVMSDKLFSADPLDAIRDQDFQCQDLMIGTTGNEGSLITAMSPEFGAFGEKNHQPSLAWGELVVKRMAGRCKDPDSGVRHYLPRGLRDSGFAVRNQTMAAIHDVVHCPHVFYAERCASLGRSVFFFSWRHRSSRSSFAPWLGATHFSEVPFVFGTPLLHPEQYTREEVALSMEAVRAWTNFVKFGSPGVDWPLFTKESPKFKPLGLWTSPEEMGPPSRENCDFLRSCMGA